MENNHSPVPSPPIKPDTWRRRLGWLIISAIVLVPPFLFRHHLKVENVGQIREGMTQVEVEALLGGPPGIYPLHGDAIPMFPQPRSTRLPVAATGRFWVG